MFGGSDTSSIAVTGQAQAISRCPPAEYSLTPTELLIC